MFVFDDDNEAPLQTKRTQQQNISISKYNNYKSKIRIEAEEADTQLQLLDGVALSKRFFLFLNHKNKISSINKNLYIISRVESKSFYFIFLLLIIIFR